MTINQRITSALSKLNGLRVGSKLVMAAAVLSVVGVTGLTTGTVSAQSNNNQNRSFPTSTADCSDWRRFGNDFRNRGDCVSWVQHHNGQGNDDRNGYGGGGGNNNGGGLGQVIRQLFSFLSNLIQSIFAFLGRLF